MKLNYYAVIWGDEDRDDDGDGIPTSGPAQSHHALRLSEKTDDPYKACRMCWGIVTENMWIKNLGPHVAPLRTNWKRMQLLSPMHGTWIRIHKEGSMMKMQSKEYEPLFWVDGQIQETV